ncbi:uroporphyrinogen-III C-methyltransferase [Marinospirillum perlucidum]|uniref:uroporphyrinogen-III C-methyltransferase n=1 Tax=Marinospirillum perlucidum TaxID=1982602 RepID=UPI000DF2272D|nr:uroporphyrinogen-III C-methyltransferase [Marinospirillum perlucidum]
MSDQKKSEAASSDDKKQQDPSSVTPAKKEDKSEGASSTAETTNQKKASSTATPAASRSKTSSGVASGLVVFLLILLFALIAGLSWLGYQKYLQFQQELSSLHQQVETKPNQDQVEELALSLQQLESLEANQQRFNQQLDLYHQQVQENQLEFEALHADLLKASEPKPKDWQLAEVEYLLRLANQRLQLERDVTGALTLFKTAQVRLQTAEVAGTLAIRNQLQEEIAQLQELQVIDRVSLALELQSLADQALTLKVQPLPQAPSLDMQAAVEAGSEELAWYEIFWQEIKSLVVIKKRELPVEPLPFTRDEVLLRQQISSLLQQASWAGLRGEADLYQQSLAGVARRLQAFDLDLQQNQAFVEAVEQLQQEAVTQELPDVEGSLDRLQAFIAERYGRLLPVAEDPEEPAVEASGEAGS